MMPNDEKTTEARINASWVLLEASSELREIATSLDPGERDHAQALADQLSGEAARFVSSVTVSGESEEPEVTTRPLVLAQLVYDQRAVHDRGSIKWYDPFTDLGDRKGSTRRTRKRGICVHHTAVRGGFGTHASRKQAWLGYATEVYEKVRQHPLVVQPNGDSVRTSWLIWDPTTFVDFGHWAECMALADRYRGYVPGKYNTGVPYHVVRTAADFMVLNLPFEWVTWHGDGSNTDFLGFAWDGDSRHDTFQAEDLYEDLKYVLDLARDEGHPIEELTGHCAWTRKPADPGKATVEVMAQLASEEGLTILWDFKVEGGRSLGEVRDDD